MISRISVTSPQTLQEAYALLAVRPNGLKVLAGGTDVMVQFNARVGLEQVRHVLDIWKLPELRGIRRVGEELVIGALTTYSELIASAEVMEDCPALVEVSREVGAWAIQNRGTLGGNLCNASPAGDTLPLLIATGARLRVGGPSGERTLPIDEFFVSYRKTALRPDELLLDITLPRLEAARNERLVYRKVGTRKAQSISKTLLALRANVDGDRLTSVRVGAGCLGPVPLRCRHAEQALMAAPLGPERRMPIRQALEQDIQPIDDVRSTADYRRLVTGNVLLRLVEQVLSSAKRAS
ncbi:MAG: xanthine dehydrogenase family protein subunit M [Myxococcota bacterium]|nr:xanthine dehydrogenase family protein subunit M [Myxococcota bacterium]